MEITHRLLDEEDREAFIAWRGGDAYVDRLLRDSLAEYAAGLRSILIAVAGQAGIE